MYKNLNVLIEIKNKKKKLNMEAKKKIYLQCEKKIILYAEMNKYECIFEVPYIVFGLPKYDIYEIIKYIIKKLNKKQIIDIYLFNNNKLYINWYKLVN